MNSLIQQKSKTLVIPVPGAMIQKMDKASTSTVCVISVIPAQAQGGQEKIRYR